MAYPIDFGSLGLDIGDVIVHVSGPRRYVVCSGRRPPGIGGGTLLRPVDGPGNILYSLRCMTRRIEGQPTENDDIWLRWLYRGQTLRAIHRRLARRSRRSPASSSAVR
ncbi:MAG: hypothetical protein JXA57_18165 [Armatimonadetes bacterium]|nr:hypothetical protein [Armatimonadota bacterium]